MKFKNLLLAGAAVAAMGLAAARPAQAVTIPFASFLYAGPATVVMDNTTGLLTGTNIAIGFSYDSTPGHIFGTPAPGYGTLASHLNFTATRIGNAGSAGALRFQDFDITSFSITLDTPFGGLTNLLSGSASGASVVGTFNGSTASMSASEGGGSTIDYSSDFLSFPVATDKDLSWTFTSLTPGLQVGANNNLRSFNSTVAGTFGHNPPPTATSVPEPGVVATLCGLGVSGTIFFGRGRMRRRK